MPEQLLTALPAQEAADLIAFLASLKYSRSKPPLLPLATGHSDQSSTAALGIHLGE